MWLLKVICKQIIVDKWQPEFNKFEEYIWGNNWRKIHFPIYKGEIK
jgi:hypothetical protein